MMVEKAGHERISLFILAISFCLIPVIKIGVSLRPHALPWHLLLFTLACLWAALQFKIYTKKIYWIIAFIFLIYSVPQLIKGTENVVTLKYIAASFISLSFAYTLLLAFQNKDLWISFLRLVFSLLRYCSIFIFLVCMVSLYMAQAKWPIFHSWSAWKNILFFSRSDIILRNKIIAGSNLALVVTGDYSLTSMQGPQLLIYPLLHSTLAYLFPQSLKVKAIDKIVGIFLILGIFMINSRAMFLYLILLIINKYIRGRGWMESFCSILLLPFPLVLVFLGSHFLNGRTTHIQYVINNISLWGHGIGSGLRDLARIPETLNSYAFDDIHLEAIHYFGILGYIGLFSVFLYFILIRKCSGRFYITFLVFVFLSLNFNLFDPYFLIPVVLLIKEPPITSIQSPTFAMTSGD